MKIKFWGVRGSLPSPLSGVEVREKILRALRECPPGADPEEWLDSVPFGVGSTYGGETPCVEISSGERKLIIDAGTGMRNLGLKVMKEGEHKRPLHILFSHFHWDHIQGLPFFVPLLVPDAEVHFYSGREDIKELLRVQNSRPFFPLDFSIMEERVTTHCVKGTVDIDGFKVSIIPLEHVDVSYGYRIEDGGSCVVYITDLELLESSKEKMEKYREFIRDADLIIADMQYGFVETHEKRTWGHSSIFAFVDLVAGANVKTMALYHHDPTSTDDHLDRIHEDAEKYVKTQPGVEGLKMIPSYVGMELEV